MTCPDRQDFNALNHWEFSHTDAHTQYYIYTNTSLHTYSSVQCFPSAYNTHAQFSLVCHAYPVGYYTFLLPLYNAVNTTIQKLCSVKSK